MGTTFKNQEMHRRVSLMYKYCIVLIWGLHNHKLKHSNTRPNFRNQETKCDNNSKKKKDKNPNTGNSYILKCQKYI